MAPSSTPWVRRSKVLKFGFGVPGSALFGHVATASADGAAYSSYDSFASLGGGVLMLNMMFGEVAPGERAAAFLDW